MRGGQLLDPVVHRERLAQGGEHGAGGPGTGAADARTDPSGPGGELVPELLQWQRDPLVVDGGGRGAHHGGVPVLADHVPFHRGGWDVQMAGEGGPVAGAVQVRADAEYPLAAGEFGEQPAHHVDRVGHHQHRARIAVQRGSQLADGGRVGDRASHADVGASGVGE
ncbi:hypothetical protein ACF1G3_25755 [Streptomyces rochei]|uniref:hypothetical protein n=1 Tax=Streptomyces rochei TaxID=1928 RepID=UPI003700427A